MTLIDLENVKALALERHAGQTYGDEFPYHVHLRAVEAVAIRFGLGIFCRACCWGHDLLEDTDTTYEELEMYFGKEFADAIKAGSNPKGMSRKEAAKFTYPAISQNYHSILWKLCDRISNSEMGGKKFGMYKKEYPAFKAALNRPEVFPTPELAAKAQEMWQVLDRIYITTPVLV